MHHLDVIELIILLLAVVGYAYCLSRFFWTTTVLTLALAGYLSRHYPFADPYLGYWIVAAFAFVVFSFFSWGNRIQKPKPRPPADAGQKGAQEIVIDGTNVLYWGSDEADLHNLRAVVTALRGRGYLPFVFLDASTRHHLKDKSLTEKDFARALDLPQKRVMVCPAKTEADVFLLKYARQQGLPVVSNDRFGDRHEMTRGLKLIKGVIANGKPIFEGF